MGNSLVQLYLGIRNFRFDTGSCISHQTVPVLNRQLPLQCYAEQSQGEIVFRQSPYVPAKDPLDR